MVYRVIKMICCLIVLWGLFFLNHYGTVLSNRKSTESRGKAVTVISYVLIVLFLITVVFVIRKL